ncbi:sugar-binding transcriptional regulator [Clostridium oryzae]|uniref:sugar-binding transcriptional regulator n=1 Tax=Clostridium oryzae TaxID=1450648 RepID=UPI0009A4BD3C|nr:sugar-binding domain-containing protein [Clostridium oryzae]
MEEILKLQQKIVPELIELLEKRYNILRTIYYHQPVGRRILANNLNLGERIVRTEINFLKSANLIEVSTPGMTVTEEGEDIVEKLKSFIHEIKGLSYIESLLAEKLNIKRAIVVPGNMDEDSTIIKELGRAAANHIRSMIKDDDIIALTGGSTIREVVQCMPKLNSFKDVLVVPARGGMGKDVEIQANTLAASFAKKIGAVYKLLHIPDNISDRALDTMLNEKDIKDIIHSIKRANILIYGIGRADQMARRRGVEPDKLDKLNVLGAVGEAFGCYFNRKGEVVYFTPTIGINNSDIRTIRNPVAVAGGKNKAEAIVATENGNTRGVLITDEGAAKEVLKILNVDLEVDY